MARERLYPDSEGGWICERHKVERGHGKHGSNCYRCADEKNDTLNKRIAELEKAYKALSDIVQIHCDPPDDCKDPVVLKTYMKACYKEAMKVNT